MDQPVSGDESIAIDHLLFHPEIVTAVPDQLVGFNEGPFIEQQIDPLARGKLAFGVLPRPAIVPTSRLSTGMASANFIEAVRHKN
jgi:hypothetical protein